ncbi:MAG: oligosaccharide flippase family protein [Clostridia bacterium]|nr:oligosaccharide flippase family protein [Clostridia bacterium]
MKGYVFIKNTVILTVTSLLLRALGLVFKVWTSSAVGAEGVGLYQLITSVYILAATFASSGICTGVTRLISEKSTLSRKYASAVLRKSTFLTVVASAVLGSALFLSADFIAKYILCDTRCALSIKILCFALPFKGTAACIKGYYYARSKTMQPSLCQLFEQIVRIGAVAVFVTNFKGLGAEMLTAALLIGDTVGEFASFIYIYIAYTFEKRNLAKAKAETKGITREILRIAAPITCSRYIMSGLHLAESSIVPTRLAVFSGSRSVALSQYGMLKGMALPLVFFPASFLSALSVMLLPETSQAAAKGDQRKIKEITRRCVGITLTAAIIISGIFFYNAKPLGVMIFGSEEVGFMIRMLALIIPFMYLESVVDGMLKGLDQQKASLFYNVADSVLRMTLIFLFVSKSGIIGFLSIMILSNVITSSLNTARLIKTTNSGFDIKNWVLKPIIAALVGGAAAYLVSGAVGIGSVAATIIGIVIQLTISVLALVILKADCVEEIFLFIPSRKRRSI